VDVMGGVAFFEEALGVVRHAGGSRREEALGEELRLQRGVEYLRYRDIAARARLADRPEQPLLASARRQEPHHRPQRRKRRTEDGADALFRHALAVVAIAREHLVGA